MISLLLLYIPCADAQEARRLASLLLERRLIACANILPEIESLYEWDGEIQQQKEAVLFVKTQAARQGAIRALIEAEHSYDCPAILTFEASASEVFGAWVLEQTTQSTSKISG